MRLSQGKKGKRYRVLNYNSLTPYYKKQLESKNIYPNTVLKYTGRISACCAVIVVEGNGAEEKIIVNLAKKIMVKELKEEDR